MADRSSRTSELTKRPRRRNGGAWEEQLSHLKARRATSEWPALLVELLEPGEFRVSGGREPHLVTIGADRAVCDCRDYTYRRRSCKHLQRVIEHLIHAPLLPSTAAGPGLEADVPAPSEAADG